MESLSRRRFIKRLAGGLGAVTLTSLGPAAYARLVEPHWLRLSRLDVRLDGLQPHLDGFKVLLLSDLHRGPQVDQSHIAQAVDLAQAVQPDLVLLAGDYVSRSADYAPSCAKELARLQAPAGIHACLGNHDHWTDADAVAGALTDVGIGVLRNQASLVVEGLWVAGVDDVWERQDDLDAALSGVGQSGTVLLLAHEPDFADQVARDGRVALQLSGHTHGGQVNLPLLGPPVLPYLGQRYPAGLYQIGPMQLYVTRGVGLVSPAVRFNCRPEVTLLTLRASPGAGSRSVSAGA